MNLEAVGVVIPPDKCDWVRTEPWTYVGKQPAASTLNQTCVLHFVTLTQTVGREVCLLCTTGLRGRVGISQGGPGL